VTKPKEPDLLRVLSAPFVPRRHYACRLNVDLLSFVKSECVRLGCSQGVFLELLILAHRAKPVVLADDIFQYDSLLRSMHSTVDSSFSSSAFAKLLDSQAVP